MDSMDLPSIKNLIGVLDCLPSIVRKFWSSPWIAWKYVETSGTQQKLISWQIFLQFQAGNQSLKCLWQCLDFNVIIPFYGLDISPPPLLVQQQYKSLKLETDHPKDSN
jgi:hypothetical protein